MQLGKIADPLFRDYNLYFSINCGTTWLYNVKLTTLIPKTSDLN